MLKKIKNEEYSDAMKKLSKKSLKLFRKFSKELKSAQEKLPSIKTFIFMLLVWNGIISRATKAKFTDDLINECINTSHKKNA